ncbi:MAG: hypothetical protein M1814_005597 [Vezdaea aestivalis]|nr:MAG: hypothetical protein M1814_005597 [Vezdaea aestivalis]
MAVLFKFLHIPFFFSLLCTLVSTYAPISDDTLRSLPHVESSFALSSSLLSPLLVPRVPGTPGHDQVLSYLVAHLESNLPKWKFELHNSTSTTPAFGSRQIPFTNIIATRDPPWTREGEVGRLALVAHYDSKYTPEGFIGATDSAAPIAMILWAAQAVDEALTKKWERMAAEGMDEFGGVEEEKGVELILLDGEEAFVSWTAEDSLYGARALAEQWDNTLHPALSTYQTPLSSISLFLLLDLLGASSPVVPSYFPTTHWAYVSLSTLESRLRELNLFESHKANPKTWLSETKKKSSDFHWGWGIQDDHIPFIARGVEVLHMIPNPFPRVWHEMDDDGEHLDLDTVGDWARLVTAFVAEWMDLEGFMPSEQKRAKVKANREEPREQPAKGTRWSRTEL